MGAEQLRAHLRRLLLLAGAVAHFVRRRDECEEAASKREDSQENYAYLALSADRRPGSEDNGRRRSAHSSETRRCRASSTGRR
jgi:hypothetical protein